MQLKLFLVSALSVIQEAAMMTTSKNFARMRGKKRMELSLTPSFTEFANSPLACGVIAVDAGCRVYGYDRTTKQCSVYRNDKLTSENSRALIRNDVPTKELWTVYAYHTEDNQCHSNPCQNNGLCVDGDQTYYCFCVEKFRGDNCETYDIDDCVGDPCNGGTCQNQVNGFQCTNCPAGFTGTTCQTNIDDCVGDPCNGGTCQDQVNSFICTSCPSGFTGTTCQINIDDCVGDPCNGGTCQDQVNGFLCTSCPAGFTGTTCQTNIDDCVGDPCNGGTCQDQVNGFLCTSCPAGYTGTTCQANIDDCVGDPCNGGTCEDQVNGFLCTSCPAGFIGTTCQTKVKIECASNPCENGGICTDLVEGFSCTCFPAHTGTICETGNVMTCSAIFTVWGGDGFILLNPTRSMQPNFVVTDDYECGMYEVVENYVGGWSYNITETIDISKDLKSVVLHMENSPFHNGSAVFSGRIIKLKQLPVTVTGFTKFSDNYVFNNGGDSIIVSYTSSEISINIPDAKYLLPGDSYTATFNITYV